MDEGAQKWRLPIIENIWNSIVLFMLQFFLDEGAIFDVTSFRHSRGLHKAEFCVSEWVGIENKNSLKHKENSVKQHVYANFSARECKSSVKQLLLKQ